MHIKLGLSIPLLLPLLLLLQQQLPTTVANHLSLPHKKSLSAILHGVGGAHHAHHEHHEQHEHHEHNERHDEAAAHLQQQQHPHEHPQQQHHEKLAAATTTASTQYVHDKEIIPSSSEEDYADVMQFDNELKLNDAHLAAMPGQMLGQMPWHPYHMAAHAYSSMLPPTPPLNIPYQAYPFEHIGSIPSPRFLPIFGVPQPVFVPYPFYVPTEMFYSDMPGANPADGVANDVVMSRAATSRRPVSPNPAYARNSPIYYVRLPPTPYMFLPSLGLPQTPANPNNFGAGYSPYLSYQSLPSISPFSAVYNLPVNFIANGKPSSLYQIGGSPNDLQNPLHFANHNNNNNNNNNNYGLRPIQTQPYRPSHTHNPHNNYLTQPSYGISQAARPAHDSKMTLLKRPFLFNGRPEEIFILPNNLNSMYPEANYY